MDVVTGAFGYTGKYIARQLLARGRRVKTLTGHPERPNPFGTQVSVAPFRFDDPDALAESLRGATTLYNTYWIRFPRGAMTFEKAVENSRALIQAAKMAGVHRIVHISITNASADSPLPYFRGKGLVEQAIVESGLSYAILRPTVIFGPEDILINNIAWFLRHFPVFAVFGAGDYRIQPVFVEDVAEIAVGVGQRETNEIIDAVGPEIYTFDTLVRLIAEVVHSRARILHVHPALAYAMAKLIGYLVGDVVITRDEIEGLMANLLVSDNPPTAQTSFRQWLEQNREHVGIRYASELARHYR